MINPVLSELIEEEINFFVSLGNIFKRLDGFSNKINI